MSYYYTKPQERFQIHCCACTRHKMFVNIWCMNLKRLTKIPEVAETSAVVNIKHSSFKKKQKLCKFDERKKLEASRKFLKIKQELIEKFEKSC